jgi:hypothetical protein
VFGLHCVLTNVPSSVYFQLRISHDIFSLNGQFKVAYSQKYEDNE